MPQALRQNLSSTLLSILMGKYDPHLPLGFTAYAETNSVMSKISAS